jgi:hypothetical protein
MAFRHGKDTVVKLNAVDLSAFTNSTSFGDETEAHDTTTYGRDRKTYHAGLGDGKITIGGVYDDGAAGPRGTIKPLKAAGTAVTFLFQPEGTGAGKAQSSVSVIIISFNESAPVADMISWTCELQMTGVLNEADQA